LGTWTGVLKLFTGPQGRGLTLELRDAGNGSYRGRVTLELDRPVVSDVPDLAIGPSELRFSMPSPVDSSIRVQFNGVRVAANRLEGRASMSSDEQGWHFTGSWSVTRRQ